MRGENFFDASTDVVGTQLKLNEDAYHRHWRSAHVASNFVEQPTEVYVPLQFQRHTGRPRHEHADDRAPSNPESASRGRHKTEMNIIFQQFPAKNSGLLVGDYQALARGATFARSL